MSKEDPIRDSLPGKEGFLIEYTKRLKAHEQTKNLSVRKVRSEMSRLLLRVWNENKTRTFHDSEGDKTKCCMDERTVAVYMPISKEDILEAKKEFTKEKGYWMFNPEFIGDTQIHFTYKSLGTR